MKNSISPFLYITCVLLLLMVVTLPNTRTKQAPVKETTTTLDEYNEIKDVYLNGIMDGGIVYYYKKNLDNMEIFKLIYNEIIITVYHFKFVPFEHPESWYFYYTRKDGIIELIDRANRSEINRVSDATITKIRTIIYKNENSPDNK